MQLSPHDPFFHSPSTIREWADGIEFILSELGHMGAGPVELLYERHHLQVDHHYYSAWLHFLIDGNATTPPSTPSPTITSPII